MNALAKIHILKKSAGLPDESYRDLLERETGKRSSADMNQKERYRVITALEKIAPKQEAKPATNELVRKLQALWIAGYNLGVVKNKSDQAMRDFLKRQTGLDHYRFLHNSADASKAIDVLKIWIRRETGNAKLFTYSKGQGRLLNDFRFQICLHIWTELVKQDRTPGNSLQEYLANRQAHTDVQNLTPGDWIACMNALGSLIRREGKK